MELEGIMEAVEEAVYVNAHSSISVTMRDYRTVYFDPFKITEEDGEDPHDAAIIFFTHSHHDHFSPEDFAGLMNAQTRFVMPESMVQDALAANAGISEDRIVALAPGQTATINCSYGDVAIEAFAAYNIGKQYHPRQNNWLGYVAEIDGVRYAVAGDTDATEELRQVDCDVLLIPVGGTFTMDAREAAALVDSMPQKPTYVIPTHYGCIVGEATDGNDFADAIESDVNVLIFVDIEE